MILPLFVDRLWGKLILWRRYKILADLSQSSEDCEKVA